MEYLGKNGEDIWHLSLKIFKNFIFQVKLEPKHALQHNH